MKKYTEDDYCDIYEKKICDNCGKCLEMQGIDTKAIKIEDIAKTVEENKILDETAAKAILLANIGDAQGLAANANNTPIINGKNTSPLFLFCGIFFTIAGNCISKIPKRFKPNIIIIEAKTIITAGDVIEVNARPDKAHATPMMLKTEDNPSEKNII